MVPKTRVKDPEDGIPKKQMMMVPKTRVKDPEDGIPKKQMMVPIPEDGMFLVS